MRPKTWWLLSVLLLGALFSAARAQGYANDDSVLSGGGAYDVLRGPPPGLRLPPPVPADDPDSSYGGAPVPLNYDVYAFPGYGPDDRNTQRRESGRGQRGGYDQQRGYAGQSRDQRGGYDQQRGYAGQGLDQRGAGGTEQPRGYASQNLRTQYDQGQISREQYEAARRRLGLDPRTMP